MKNDATSNTLYPDVHWPAVICYHGDDELIYVADEADWQQNTQGDASIIEGEDKLIDSKGQVFNLTEHSDKLSLIVTNKRILLVDLLLLVQKNACLVQQVCSAKIHTTTYYQAIEIVSDINEMAAL